MAEKSVNEHANGIMQYIARADEFHDVTLIGNNETEKKAHRIILAAVSGYLRALFRNDPQENRFTLNEIDGATLQNVIDFIYTGKENFTENNLFAVFSAAIVLEIKELNEKCREQFINQIKEHNCSEYLLFAEKKKLEYLLFDVQEKIAALWPRIDADQMKKIPAKYLKEIVETARLDFTEKQIFYGLRKWVEGNAKDDNRSIRQEVLKLLKLGSIKTKVSCWWVCDDGDDDDSVCSQ